ncbi:MAG: putative type 4 fimbrial biosis PilW-related protein transrane [Herminiimonas sp.]|nr:putative type 4 fimbrial biosis PilW-related protein transrane [Herminiimonas sp.]
MNPKQKTCRDETTAETPQSGFSLIELMISITISLLIMLALITVFVNINRSNAEMARANSQIENGRFAMQLLESDLVHAGFLGGYVPQYDDLSSYAAPSPTSTIGGSVPTSVPDPCLAYNSTNWTAEYKGNLIGIPVQAYNAIPASCALSPSFLTNQQANTDVLVVRHVETCEAGVGSCDNTAGKLYFQSSFCEADISGSYAQAGAANTITLAATASATDNFYNGLTIRILSGPGVNQTRVISAYNGTTKVATVSSAWTSIPSGFSKYVFGVGYVLDTTGHTFTKRDCSTFAAKRKFVSNIYYIRNFAVTAGDGIPTLVRSQFDLASGTLAHQLVTPLIEGIEGFKVEFGIDNLSDSGAATNYTQAIAWADPTNLISPTNRGDSTPDGAFIRCTTAAPCTAAQLMDVVAVKLYVLVRSRDTTPGYTDSKTYYLDSARATAVDPCVDSAGTALTGAALTTCRSYKRHVFSTTVRLTNISGRRETP